MLIGKSHDAVPESAKLSLGGETAQERRYPQMRRRARNAVHLRPLVKYPLTG
jgi:hypothetical protein